MKRSLFEKTKCKIKIVSLLLIFALSQVFLFSEAIAKTHVVAKGETFYGISKIYGITVEDLCKANGISSSSILKIGQVLKIPEKGTSISSGVKTDSSSKTENASKTISSEKKDAPKNESRKYDVYTVQKGDTLWHIAQVNGISVNELKQLNNLSTDSSLKIGQELKIPVSIVDTANAVLPDLPSSDPRNYTTKQGKSDLVWPVKNPTVTYMNGKVSGVTLSSQKNEDVTVIRAGTVMYVGNYRGYGQVVFVQSKTGHIYAYCGLGTIKVQKGDYVVFGDKLGTAGVDSISGKSQVSLMVFQKSNPIDPAKAPRG